MFIFSYRVATKDRRIREGQVRAFTVAAARRLSPQEGETVIAVYREKSNLVSEFVQKYLSFGFSQFERIIFFRNLSTMTASGLSMIEALNTSAEIVKSRVAKEAILDMSNEVKNGIPLSATIRKYPKFFQSYISETVRLGELSGTLSDILDQISIDLEKDYELSRKVVQALAYPAIILIVMVILLIALMVFVLPEISNLYKEIDADLPLGTQLLLDFGNSISSYPLIYGGSILFLLSFFLVSFRIPKIRYYFHLLFLHIPVVKDITKELNLVKFFRSLETLVASGISWVRGVEVAKKTLTNDVYRKAADTIHPVLLHGGTLSFALKQYPELFPVQSRQILGVGERTGRFEETLKKVSSYHEKSLDHTTKMMTTLIEPILMILIGLTIGGIALSIFLPIYQLTEFL